MDTKISQTIELSFDTLKTTRLKIKTKIGEIDTIKKTIRQNYLTYIAKENEHFFGLDSFHFQNKAIELEHKNMLELYHFIDNRIYGDYYKLFSMIYESLKSQLTETQLYKVKELHHFKNYTIYKDLEPFKIYEFNLINQIHQDIVLVLTNINEMFMENESNIMEHRKHLHLGMNIDNYVINQKYMNYHLKMSNDLHENYLQVFHKYHNNLLHKYLEKIELFYKQICHHKEDQCDVEFSSTIPTYDIHETKDEEIPEVHDEEIPEAHDEEIPEAHDEEIPLDNEVEISEAHDEEIPLASEVEIPEAHDEEIPLANEVEIPLDNEVEISEAHDKKIPLDNEVEIPEAHDEKIPEAHDEEISDVVEGIVKEALDCFKSSIHYPTPLQDPPCPPPPPPSLDDENSDVSSTLSNESVNQTSTNNTKKKKKRKRKKKKKN